MSELRGWRRIFLALFVACIALLMLVRHVSAQTVEVDSAASTEFFETQVRPLLSEHCIACHGPNKQEGSLRLDSQAGVESGGDSGAVIDNEKPATSLLLSAIRYEQLEMPPNQPLHADAIEVLTRWVAMGAPWPEHDGQPIRIAPANEITDEDRQWWAYQPVVRPDVPDCDEPNEIDAFIVKRLRDEGLSFADVAEKRVLLRRAKFALHGLPPTPSELDEFLQDDAPDAYERLVDRLLADESYGEHMARMWLDVVRYAESDGYRADFYRPNIWRYRDYVIQAFNTDKPYDRFVAEQIAGDELFPGDREALIATGFLRHWIYEYNSRDAVTQRGLILQDLVDTTGDVFLAAGMQCARCHDHKFDPILQHDYYRLQAFFEPILPVEQIIATQDQQRDHELAVAAWEANHADILTEIAALEATARDNARAYAIGRFPDDIQAIYHKPSDEKTAYDKQISYLIDQQILYEYTTIDNKIKGDEKNRLYTLRKKLTESAQHKPSDLPVASVICDAACVAPDTKIRLSDEVVVAPGFLTLFEPEPAKIETVSNNSTGRRTGLAQWLTRPENPLTARVMVNRLWQHVFGSGLVANASDFGRLGGEPTHPELLDWLASDFVQNRWSVKTLHRKMLLSRTFKQSHYHTKSHEYRHIDPSNDNYWHWTTRRLSAEQIRDALLFVTGRLDFSRGGEGVLSDVPRRSIYTRVMRNARDPLLDVFDLPLFFSSESARNTTTTPVQALLMLNSPEFLRHATALAAALPTGKPTDERIDALWQRIYGRRASEAELNAAIEFLSEQKSKIERSAEESFRPERITGRIPYREGQCFAMTQDGASHLTVPADPTLQFSDFTVEAYFQLRSVYETGAVRVIAANWSGDSTQAGWSFGVTGQGSRRKPQTLVLLLHGRRADGTFGEVAVFSDQHIELNKPYFAAVSFHASTNETGTATFYLKDLSNDNVPLHSVVHEHALTRIEANGLPLSIGGLSKGDRSRFDGLIDDVRLTAAALQENELALTDESIDGQTLGFWRFEPTPGLLADSSPNRRNINPIASIENTDTSEQLALIDLCHALLNTNEFLYLE